MASTLTARTRGSIAARCHQGYTTAPISQADQVKAIFLLVCGFTSKTNTQGGNDTQTSVVVYGKHRL